MIARRCTHNNVAVDYGPYLIEPDCGVQLTGLPETICEYDTDAGAAPLLIEKPETGTPLGGGMA